MITVPRITRPSQTIVGITGGSGSGKTALARALMERFCATGAVLISQDCYYRGWSHLSPIERALVNYDEPAALDMELLLDHLAALRRGTPVQCPTYCFETHARKLAITTVRPAPFVLVDGILLFHEPGTVDLFDLRVFLDAPADVRLARRILRDVGERGRRVEGVLEQYLATVRTMHDRYVEPQRRHAHLVVDNGGPLTDAVDRIETTLRGRMPAPCEPARPAGR